MVLFYGRWVNKVVKYCRFRKRGREASYLDCIGTMSILEGSRVRKDVDIKCPKLFSPCHLETGGTS